LLRHGEKLGCGHSVEAAMLDGVTATNPKNKL
jgi:hypothetical protein